MKHTKEQIANWRRYEEVRQEGRFNMLDPRAQRLTGLSKEDYWYCLEQYVSLKDATLAEGQPTHG